MKRTFPKLFSGLKILPVEDYRKRLLETLQYLAQQAKKKIDLRSVTYCC